MHTATVTFKGISPYSQSKHYEVEKKERERPDDYEKRTWRERMHVTSTGYVEIPPMAFKNGIAITAKFLGKQIPGKGKSTFTKHFEAGILVLEGVTLPYKKADVPGEWLFVPGDGVRGSGKRVSKCFPVIHEWGGKVVFHVLDPTITKEIFSEHMKDFGRFVGIGRFRPQNNGYYGRFHVESIEWGEEQ